MPAFHDQSIRRLAGPEDGRREVTHWDDPRAGGVAGLGIRVLASGRRSWIVRLRVGAGQRFVTLGAVDNLTVKKARSRAGDLIADARLGNDPRINIEARKKAAAKPSLTLRGLIDLYLESGTTKLRPRSVVSIRHSLLVLAAPMHHLAPEKVERRAIAERAQIVSKDRGGRTAELFGSHLSRCFSWAMEAGLAENNPAHRLPGFAIAGGRDRVLTEAELAAVWNAVDPATNYGAIVRLLILTGQRREEVGAMRTEEINLEASIWTIPSERTKNRRAHVVPLSDPALAILRARLVEPARASAASVAMIDGPEQNATMLSSNEAEDFVFGLARGPFSAWSQSKNRLDHRLSGWVKPWRLHDLRRTVVTGMAEHLAIPPHVIEAIVNHVSGAKAGVAGIYNRATYASEKRNALENWAQYVETLALGAASRTSRVWPAKNG